VSQANRICPIVGCQNGKRPHEAICGQHWKRLPMTLQIELRKASKGLGDYDFATVLGRVQNYLADWERLNKKTVDA